MDIMKMTRDLGAAIQQDERYLKFKQARETNENDEELMNLISEIQLIQMNFQQEAGKENADEDKLKAYNENFEKLYAQFMGNEKMKAYEEARGEIDALMNDVMQLLGLCVNGEDPYTCEIPKEQHDCGGECSSCSGCH